MISSPAIAEAEIARLEAETHALRDENAALRRQVTAMERQLASRPQAANPDTRNMVRTVTPTVETPTGSP